jgi:hypothetical protein
MIVSFKKEVRRRRHSSESNFSNVSKYILGKVKMTLEKNHTLVPPRDIIFSHSETWTEYLDTISEDYQNL